MLHTTTALDLLASAGQHRPPVDVNRVAAAIGLEVRLVYCLPAKVDGHLEYDDRVILVNARAPRNRRRFTIAHEIGEFVFRQERQAHYRQAARTQTREALDRQWEDRIHRFAAELLVPAHMLIWAWHKGLGPRRMAAIFQASMQCLEQRLQELGVTERPPALRAPSVYERSRP